MAQPHLAYIHVGPHHLLVYQDGFWGMYDEAAKEMVVPLEFTHYKHITGGVYLFGNDNGKHRMISVGRINLVDIAA